MSNAMKKYITILLMVLLTACELVVDVDIPIEKRQLVLNSFFTPDSVWKAKLSLSRHILDEAPYEFVDNAEIVVFDGETPITTLSHDSLGYYRSERGGPQQGKSYNIRVTAPGYNPVEASSSCPMPITAEFSELQSTVDEFDQAAHSFTITFNDPPENNFYQVTVIEEISVTNPNTGQGFINRHYPQVWSDDPGIDSEEINSIEGIFFPDILFNNNQFSLTVKMSQSYHWSGGVQAKTKYFVYFRSISEDYYKYKVTSMLQDYTSGDPFAQPVKVYDNIKNGFGIFAGYSQSVKVYEK